MAPQIKASHKKFFPLAFLVILLLSVALSHAHSQTSYNEKIGKT